MPWLEGTWFEEQDSFLPILRVEVHIGKQSRRTIALVDSGCDTTIIPAERLAGFRGVRFTDLPKPEGSREGVGVGGIFETRLCDGRLTWRGLTLCDSFLVAEAECLPYVLLGRDDFFSRFDVRFRWDASPPIFGVEWLTEAPREPAGSSKRSG